MGFLGINPFVKKEKGFPGPHHLCGSVLQADPILPDEIGFCLLQFLIADAIFPEIVRDSRNLAERFFQVFRAERKIDLEQSGIGEYREITLHFITQPFLLADGLEEAGTHVFAEDDVEELVSKTTWVVSFYTPKGKSQVRLLLALIEVKSVPFGGGCDRKKWHRLPRREIGESGCDDLIDCVVIDISRDRYHRIATAVGPRVKIGEVAFFESVQTLLGSSDRATERMIFPPNRFADEIFEILSGLIPNHCDLLVNDEFFRLDFLRIEDWVAIEIRQNIKESLKSLRRPFDLIGSVILDRKTVNGSTEALDMTRDFLGGSGRGSLKKHVLDKMGHAVLFDPLVPTPGVGPEAKSNTRHVRHRDGGETDSVVEAVKSGGGRHCRKDQGQDGGELALCICVFHREKLYYSEKMTTAATLPSLPAFQLLGRPVELSQIEKELQALFMDESAGAGSPNAGGIARASLINLVLYNENQEGLEQDAAVLAEITSEAACRSLLINADAHNLELSAQAWVQAHCQIDRNGEKSVCTEQISFFLTGNSHGLLRNVVLANLDSDLPLAFWWRGEFSDAFEEGLFSRIDRLLFDSETWESPRNQFIRLIENQKTDSTPFVMHDFAFTRLNSIRHAIANAFDRPLVTHELSSLSRVSLRHAKGYRMTALYLAAWIALKLGAKIEAGQSTTHSIVCLYSGTSSRSGFVIEISELDPERKGTIEVDFQLQETRVEISRCQSRDFIRTLTHLAGSTLEDWLPARRLNDAALVTDILNRAGGNRKLALLVPMVQELLALKAT